MRGGKPETNLKRAVNTLRGDTAAKNLEKANPSPVTPAAPAGVAFMRAARPLDQGVVSVTLAVLSASTVALAVAVAVVEWSPRRTS